MKPPALGTAVCLFDRFIRTRSIGICLLAAFTSVAFAATTNVYEWTFDGGTLAPSIGNGSLMFADSTTATVTTFGTTGGAVPDIGGQSASFMHVPVFNEQGNGYWLTLSNTGPNGGGSYINQYTLIMDVLVPGAINWTALFNTDPGNGNDADWYIASDGSIGINALGYTAANVIVPDTWYRLAFTADLGAGLASYYLNGAPVLQRMGGSLVDGRYSLYSTNDNLPSLLLFNEGDAGGNYTHELYVAGIAMVDRTLTSAEIAGLGGPSAEGIFTRRVHVATETNNVIVTWNAAPNLRLQRTSQLTPPVWVNAPATLGTNIFIEPTSLMPARLYRLIWQ